MKQAVDSLFELHRTIEGYLIYDHAAPFRIHQTILMELAATIRDYIRSKGGACRVHPALFAVKLFEEGDTIVNPDKKNIFVYYLEQDGFKVETYTFHDAIDVNICENLQIDFAALDIWK